MGYWFTGSPEEFRAAEINSARKLQSLRGLGAIVGSVGGTMRQQREDEIKSKLAEERLQATLGEQANKAKVETSPTPAASQAAPLTPNDPNALLPEAEQTQADTKPEPSSLQRLGLAAKDVGMRGLRALGGMTGISSPYTPDTLDSASHVAQMQGRLDAEGRLNKRIGAMTGLAAVVDRPGALMTKGMEGMPGAMDLSGFARRQESGFGDLTWPRMKALALQGVEPYASMFKQDRENIIHDKRETQPAPTRNFASSLQDRAYADMLREKQREGMNAIDAANSITDAEVLERAKVMPPVTPMERVEGFLLKKLPAGAPAPVGTPGPIPGSTTLGTGKHRFDRFGPVSPEDKADLAKQFLDAIQKGEMTQDEAESILAEIP